MKAIRGSVACLTVLSFLLSFAATAEEQTPFNGVPMLIPGHIEAEYFDNGGEGIAYHDVDPRINIDYVRASDVDIDRDLRTPPGGTYYVGWTQAGEWLEYTVDVQQGGYYFVEVRFASYRPGGTFHIAFDGIDKTGPLTVPDTGGWWNWGVVAKAAVYLHAGTQVMSLVMDSNGISGSVANIDAIDFSPSVASIPGTVQAERFNDGGEGVAYHDTDAGNNGSYYRTTDVDIDVDRNFNLHRSYIGWTQAGEWLEYTIDVQTAGYYQLDVQVASKGKGGRFHIELNGVDQTGAFLVPDTGGWRNWAVLTRYRVPLNAGIQTMRITLDDVGPSGSVANFDWVRFTKTDQGPMGGVAFDIPTTRIETEWFDLGGEGVAYHDFDGGNNGAYSSGIDLRGSDVDIDHDINLFSNYYVGWTRAGEWLEYTVRVVSTGYYTVAAAVASRAQGGSFHIEFDGVDSTGPFNVPDTGGWRKWTVLTKRGIYLESGTQIMRIALDSIGPSGSVANLDFVLFTRE